MTFQRGRWEGGFSDELLSSKDVSDEVPCVFYLLRIYKSIVFTRSAKLEYSLLVLHLESGRSEINLQLLSKR